MSHHPGDKIASGGHPTLGTAMFYSNAPPRGWEA
jgi:hypothetical protein